MLPCNTVLRKQPPLIFLHRNDLLLTALSDCRTLLQESTIVPTECIKLVAGWPDFIGVKDASGHDVGGVVVGENKECTPTVFQFEWPDNVKAVLHSGPGMKGHLTNSDLEMEGLLLIHP